MSVLYNRNHESFHHTNDIVNNVLNFVKNSSIVLMHDGGNDRSQTVAALPTIIQSLQKQGYQFVTVQQMVAGG